MLETPSLTWDPLNWKPQNYPRFFLTPSLTPSSYPLCRIHPGKITQSLFLPLCWCDHGRPFLRATVICGQADCVALTSDLSTSILIPSDSLHITTGQLWEAHLTSPSPAENPPCSQLSRRVLRLYDFELSLAFWPHLWWLLLWSIMVCTSGGPCC